MFAGGSIAAFNQFSDSMDFDFYQEAASGTDQFAGQNVKKDEGLMIPLLGIAGETGTLLAEFKKKIRDKDSYEGFQEKAEEELGDILWYLSNIATRMGLSLSEIASKNLQKTNERWPMAGDTPEMFMYFDEGNPPKEQLPRLLKIHVFESKEDKRAYMKILPDGAQLGDPLTDNAYDDDGYRFHDVMHLSNLAVLGWSPVVRSLLKLKRKSQPKTDEVEDGARAIILEELVVAFVYGNARERKYYQGVKHLDSEMLSTIKRIVRHLEVGTRKTMDWEDAIFQGYAVFRHLLEKREAVLQVDMKKRKLTILK